ncbi:guanylate-binding protein 6-like [Talpa occidentalis]|nr:guanylate-binding protein 6-like [Talpa occidentalis]
MILEHKLKMQEDMLTEGFKKKSEEMNAEIIHLRKEIEKNKEEKDSSWISRAFDILDNPQSAARVAKVMDLGLMVLGNLF